MKRAEWVGEAEGKGKEGEEGEGEKEEPEERRKERKEKARENHDGLISDLRATGRRCASRVCDLPASQYRTRVVVATAMVPQAVRKVLIAMW